MKKFQIYKQDEKPDSRKKYLNNSERLVLVEQNLMILQELVVKLLEKEGALEDVEDVEDIEEDIEEEFPESPDSKKVKK